MDGLSAPGAYGYAYRKYLGQCKAKQDLDAEFRASRSRVGLWQVPGVVTRPWDFLRGRVSRRSASATGSIPGGRIYRRKQSGSYQQAQMLLHQGHTYLDGNGDGEACESLR